MVKTKLSENSMTCISHAYLECKGMQHMQNDWLILRALNIIELCVWGRTEKRSLRPITGRSSWLQPVWDVLHQTLQPSSKACFK